MRRATILTTGLVLVMSACSDAGPDDDPEPGGSPSTPAVDVATTDPGTDLGLGDSAVLVWQPASGLTGALDLRVESVAEQRRSVLDGWARDEAMATSRPYFVTVALSNVGESDLAGQVVPLYLRDDNGALGAPWTLGGDFTACQSGPLPSPFGPGAEAEMCLLYLVPAGARIRDLVFEPTEGYDPITWRGEVEPRTRRSDKDERRNGRKGG